MRASREQLLPCWLQIEEKIMEQMVRRHELADEPAPGTAAEQAAAAAAQAAAAQQQARQEQGG